MNFLDILSTCKWSELISSDNDKKPYSLPCSTFTNNFTGLTFVGQQRLTKGATIAGSDLSNLPFPGNASIY